ncbi:MAG: carboxypeptidase-like regulatory domain-containing protein, partial [Bryobacteraceae bacterium]
MQRLLPALILLCSLEAQTFLGGLRGRVGDSAGGAVASAKVTLTNQSSNAVLETVTNAQGEYAFPALNPATYVLAIEQSGFKKFQRGGIVVATQGFYTVDVMLEVGELSQSIQ